MARKRRIRKVSTLLRLFLRQRVVWDDELDVPVEVIDAATPYGCERLLVKAVGGVRTKWVDAAKCRIVGEGDANQTATSDGIGLDPGGA